MASRALIIAIEEYPETTLGMMEKKLPGVIESATAFRSWLEAKWTEESVPESEIIFCSEPQVPGGVGASWKEIVNALKSLKEKSAISSTDELYFYFSGHGFRFERSFGTQSDVLVASDFDDSGNLCLKLDEIVNWLCSHLGRGRQYFFIDACRNVLDASQIRVNDVLPWKPTMNGQASCYVLQSTVSGAPALVASSFAKSLLGGLNGESRAKVWSHNPAEGMLVRYDSLRTYLKEKLANEQPITSRVEGEDGETDAIFKLLPVPPKSTLNVKVRNTDEGAKATLRVTRIRNDFTQDLEIEKSLDVPVLPDDYLIELTSDNLTFSPPGEQQVNLYEARQSLIFEATPPGLESSFSPELVETEADVDLELPDSSILDIRSIDQDFAMTITRSGTETLPFGRYETTLRSSSGTVLHQKTLDLNKGMTSSFDPVGIESSAAHQQILKEFGQPGISPWFSESLGGGMDDPDLGIWLTIMAGGKILGSDGRFSKLSPFQLLDFSNAPPGCSPVFVVAGFDSTERELKIGLGNGPSIEWKDATSPSGLPGVREAVIEASPGAGLVSLKIDDHESISVSTYQYQNHVTLLILTEEEGLPTIAQFILPLGHLVNIQQPAAQDRLQNRNCLSDLKFVAQATRAFRQRRNLDAEFSIHDLTNLIDGHLLDPIGLAIIGYEFVRRGKIEDLPNITRHLSQNFPDFPDGPAIAHLAGENVFPTGIPLFLEGWLSLRGLSDAPEAPQGNLNYRSTFTTWLGAIH